MKLGHSRAVGLSLTMFMLAGVACGGRAKRTPPTTVATTTPSTLAVAGPSPLTGVLSTDPVRLARPALVVKIDNIAAARPQASLDAADLIYEELAEGGLTRFVAVFQSRDAASVGPVRSARPSDLDIVAPLNPLFAYSGAAPSVVSLLRGGRLTDVGFDANPDAFMRRRDRSSPQNLYTTTDALYARAKPSMGPPPPFGPFLAPDAAFAASGAVPAIRASLAAGPVVRADYDFDPPTRTWKRSTDGRPHLLEGGGQIAPATVIVQSVGYKPFASDSNVFVAQTVGSGDATVLTAGMSVKVRWSKTSPTAVTIFTDSAGAPVVLPPGQTLVHLVAPGAPLTVS